MRFSVEEPAQNQSSAAKRAARPQPNCVLCVGDQHLPAAIIEERGGTIHIVVQGSPQFWVEDDGTLKTPDGEFSVRVFNIVREESDEDENDEVVGEIPMFRVGLERLGPVDRDDDPEELDQPETEPTKTAAAAKNEKKTRISPLNALALVMAAAVLVGAVVIWKNQFGNWSLGLGLPGSSNSAGDKPGSSNAEEPGSTTAPRLSSELSKLPGAVPFSQPEVARTLDLTPTQTDAIQRLNKITLDAVNDLEKYWGSGDRWELAQKRTMLLDEARQQALQVLTAPQRKLWNELTK